jgi:hypothetical protein
VDRFARTLKTVIDIIEKESPPMTSVPAYYRKFYIVSIRFSVIMMILGLLIGITFQESAKKAPVSALLPPGVHLEAVLELALTHGHIFIIGALIPLALTWMLSLVLSLGFPPVPERNLRLGTIFYLPGAAGAVLLMLYKGYHYLLGVRGGQLNFEILDHTFFFGNHALRAAAYGLSHSALAIGLIMVVVGVWKSMKKPADQR